MGDIINFPARLGSIATLIVGEPLVADVARALKDFGTQGAFLAQGLGFWQGQAETATLIKIDGLRFPAILDLAASLKETFKQDAVLVEYNGEAYLV